MRTHRTVRGLAAVLTTAATIAVALPTSAAAHPGLYFTAAKNAKSNEIQTITVDATAGSFKPSAGASEVAFNAPAYVVERALGTDPAIGVNATTLLPNVLVTVANPAANPHTYTLTYIGAKAGTNVAVTAPATSGTDPLTGGTGVSSTNPTQGGTSTTFTNNGAITADQAAFGETTQVLIANDGYVGQFTETNGLAQNDGRGWLNLKFNPGTYRTPESKEDWLAYGPAQTGIQTHATCVQPAGQPLMLDSNIKSVTPNSSGDPFWRYIPWQKTSVGLGDEPEKWIDTVKALYPTVDLAALSTAGDFRAACESAPVNGVYVPADTAGSSVVSAAVADATTPLSSQITSLTAQVASLTAQVADLTGQRDALTAAKAAAEAAKASLESALGIANGKVTTLTGQNDVLTKQVADLGTHTLNVRLGDAKVREREHVAVLVTGTPGSSVTITITVTKAQAKGLGLRSTTLAREKVKLDDAGAGIATIDVGKQAAAALARHRGAVKASVDVASGIEKDAVVVTLT